jgi:predicted RNA-binding Zn-ribbon protein involved in translation (DUF1610 family)
MSEPERKRRKRKKQQTIILTEQDEEMQTVAELTSALDELEKEGKTVEVQVCPKCKSLKVRRVKTMEGDMSSHLGWLPPKFECEDCGWHERLVLKATNKRLSVKDVEIIAEALDSDNQ